MPSLLHLPCIIFALFHISECPMGYFGGNCEKQCPYPLFGNYCRLSCNCTKDECNSVKGCVQWESTGKSYTKILHYEFLSVRKLNYKLWIVYPGSITNLLSLCRYHQERFLRKICFDKL